MMDRSIWDATFSRRFARHEDELRWLYMELYHGDAQAWDYFVSMLWRCWTERPASLRALDEQREANPDWYTDHSIVGMQMYVNAFGPTLRDVQERLPYLEEAGVRYLHLMPLMESPEGRSDGGYAVSDFRKVDPRFGTTEDLAALTEACHARGMAVCLDFVMNHTSEDHEWARKARAGDVECQNRYFFYDNWDIPNEFERTVPQVFPVTAPGSFSWCEEAQKVVMTSFYPYQWDLNYANPTVFNDMTDNLLFLCNHGVDVLRLDATPYIWKELHTTCRNLPQVHTLVRMTRMACEIVCPSALLLGEVVMEPSKVVPYFGTVEKPECHMLYNVTTMATLWHTVATRDVRLMRHQLRQVFALPGQYTFLNYLRCHDDIGWGLDYPFLAQFGQAEVAHKKYLNDFFTGVFPGSWSHGELYNNDPRLGDARLCGTTASLCGVEKALEDGDEAALDLALRRDITLHALILALSGVPVLYSGDEIAQLNDNGYHADPLKADDSRYIHRGDFRWDKAEKRGDLATPEGRVFHALRRLETLRAEHPVFASGADLWLTETGSDEVLGFGRYAGAEKLAAMFSFSDEERTVPIPGSDTYTDLISGETGLKGSVTLPPWGFRWLLCTHS